MGTTVFVCLFVFVACVVKERGIEHIIIEIDLKNKKKKVKEALK